MHGVFVCIRMEERWIATAVRQNLNPSNNVFDQFDCRDKDIDNNLRAGDTTGMFFRGRLGLPKLEEDTTRYRTYHTLAFI